MFKKSLLIMLLVACMAPWAVAQETYTIGSGNDTDSNIPIRLGSNNSNKYSLSEQIYTASELSAAGCPAGDIQAIAYKNTSGNSRTRTLEVYITTTTKSTFTSYEDVVSVASSDLVFSGSATFPAGKWGTITLDTPYSWDGSSNLLVLVYDKSNSTSGTTNFSTYTTSSYTAIYKSASTSLDPTNMAAGSDALAKNNIVILTIEEATNTPKPKNLDVTTLGITNATIEWTAPTATEGYTLTGYECQYQADGAASWTSVTPSGPSCSLIGLTCSTGYTFQVRATYTDSQSEPQYSGWAEISFTTNCAEMSVPTTTWNFDANTNMPDCWTIAASYKVPVYGDPVYPQIYNSSSYSHSGSNTLAFRGTGVQVVLMPTIKESLNSKTLSFYVRAYSTSYTNTLYIGYYNLLNEFVAYSTLNINNTSYNQDPNEIDFTGLPDYVKTIAIKGVSSNNYGYIYLDDIKIDATLSCKPVKGLQLGTITSNSAKLKWNAENEETNWKLQYKTNQAAEYTTININESELDNDGYYTLGSLTDNTTYNWQVAAWCDPEDPSTVTDYVAGTNFTTTQSPVTIDATHSFSDDFESVNKWIFVNLTDNTNVWVLGDATHNGDGSNAMYISNDGGTTNAYTITKSGIVYASKLFSFDAGTYTFQYDWKANGEDNYDYLRVALVPGNTELTPYASTIVPSGFGTSSLPTGWIAIDGGSKLNLSNSFQTKEIPDITIPAGEYKVVFAWRNDGGGGSQVPAAIDNFSITTPACSTPTSLSESNVHSNSATISWVAAEGQDAWVLEYSTSSSFPEGETTKTINADDNIVTLSSANNNSLATNQTYYVRVKADCGGGNTSSWSATLDFTTLAILPPTSMTVSNVATTSVRLNWTGVSTNDNHTSYDVCYNTTSTVPATLIEDENYFTGITDAYYDLTGLTEGTTYYAWVRDNCGTTSSWAAFGSFTTSTLVDSSHAIIEDFDDNYTSLPTGWTRDIYWSISTIYKHNDSYGAAYSGYSGTCTLLTPIIEISSEVSSVQFSFWSYTKWPEDFGTGSNKIYLVGSPNVQLWNDENHDSEWRQHTIDLSKYAGQTIQLAFEYTKSGSGHAWAVDDVTIKAYDKVFNGDGEDWDYLTNWTPNGLPQATDKVFINSVCTIDGDVVATADEIDLGSAGSITIAAGGQLICNNNPVITANKTTSAWNTTDKGWYLISSPVNNIEIEDFVTNDDHNVYSYIEKSRYWNEYRGEVNTTLGTAPFTKLDNGRGYLYRSEAANLAFSGNTNVGPVEYTLSYTATEDDMDGFNLIGNPYPHNIYKGVAIPSDKLVSQYCVLTTTGTWTLTNDNVAIAPMQAVLVQATSAGNIEIADNAAAPVGKYANDNIWFTVKNNEFTDVACVEFKEGHGFNKPEHRNENAPMLYIINNGERFASACMPDNTSVINLGFEAKTMGEYTISLKAEGQYSYMHLIDKLTGEDIDMLVEDSYTFIGSQNDRKDRFVLRLNYNAAGIDSESDIFAYQSGNEIIVNGEGTLEVFDVTGRKVMATTINGVQTVNGLNNGFYIFRLNEKTQKIVVR